MKPKDKEVLFDKDLPLAGPITRRAIEITRKRKMSFRGSMRVSTGRIWTDEEYEARRRRVLSTPLP